MTLTPTCPLRCPRVFPSPGWTERASEAQVQQDLTAAIARHGAPTILGHKAGSLFLWQTSCPHPEEAVGAMDEGLACHGVRVLLMGRCPSGCRIYVYRPALLRLILQQEEVAELLRNAGYAHQDEGSVRELQHRLLAGGSFPHEIGLFLGYPLEDVQGFIRHGGANCLLSGCWKVYDNPNRAARLFALYHRCTRTCMALLTKGVSLATMAGLHPTVTRCSASAGAASHRSENDTLHRRIPS